MSILVIGASSRTGVECIQQLSLHPSRPSIHAFCEDLSELEQPHSNIVELCSTVFEGSIRHAIDVDEAMELTRPNWVILCGDSSDDSPSMNRRQKDIRTVSAKNLVRVLTRPDYAAVRVLVVSRIGAPGTLHNTVKLGLRGRLCQLRQSEFLLDNAGQEQALRAIWSRTTVVRTTAVTDSITGSGRKIVELSDHDTIPSLTTERTDLAICSTYTGRFCVSPPNKS